MSVRKIGLIRLRIGIIWEPLWICHWTSVSINLGVIYEILNLLIISVQFSEALLCLNIRLLIFLYNVNIGGRSISSNISVYHYCNCDFIPSSFLISWILLNIRYIIFWTRIFNRSLHIMLLYSTYLRWYNWISAKWEGHRN